MRRFQSHASVLLMTAVLGLFGCGGVSATTRMYPDAPTFAPTDASAVEVLRSEPSIPYVRLGEVTLSLQGNPSQDALSKAMQKQAAQMGATAVVLVFDGSNSMGVMYSGPLWTPPPPDPMMQSQQVLVAVAIRYN
jgi:hypothetical protein